MKKEEGDGVEVEIDAEANEMTTSRFSILNRHIRVKEGEVEEEGVEMLTRRMILLDRSRVDLAQKFEFVDRLEPGTTKPRLKQGGDDNIEGEDNNDGDGDGGGGLGDGDIEDVWGDPLVLDSNPVPGRGKDASPSPLAKSRPAARDQRNHYQQSLFDSESEDEGRAHACSWTGSRSSCGPSLTWTRPRGASHQISSGIVRVFLSSTLLLQIRIVGNAFIRCHVSCRETSGDGDWTLASTYVLRLRRASCPELAEESQTTAE